MRNKMKTVGIIGGLGPETSAKFYLELVSSCLKKNKTLRPPILIWNIPLPLKIEEELLIKDIGEKRYLPFLIEAAQILEKAGADFLVMPCNTMHIFIEEIRSVVNIPILSIIDETVLVINKRKILKVGVLATSTTIRKRLFQNGLKAIGVKEIVPNKKQQQKLDKIIHNLATSRQNLEDKIEIEKIIGGMIKQDVKNIVLACTDLQLIIKERSDVEILDTMKVLVNATVKKITNS